MENLLGLCEIPAIPGSKTGSRWLLVLSEKGIES